MNRFRYSNILIVPILVIVALLASFCTPRESQVDSKEVAEEKNKEKFTTKDAKQNAKFVTDVVALSLAEVRLAELALEKTRDEEVRQIASHIKNDHAMLLADLTDYSAAKVITVPLTESEDVRKRILKLQAETESFDKNWCNEVQNLHKQSIEMLEKNTDKISDPELRNWIASTLPRLRKNLDLVSACYNRVR